MGERPFPYPAIAMTPIEGEADHYLRCPRCGTWIDCRKLLELLAHEDWCTVARNTHPMPERGMQ